MKQFAQKLRDGQLSILEVPLPALTQGAVLVRNYFSIISTGTEGSRIRAARQNYYLKAKSRPHQFKRVVESLKQQGLFATYRTVMQKLDSFSPVGSSCVGEVTAIGDNVTGLKIGDFVACAGPTASHAEIVCVPYNLCVLLNPSTDLKCAAYNTLGAIAMQGVRQADLKIGETCAVIGLGLVGQLTAVLLRASGVKVIGVDTNSFKVEMASKTCLDFGISRAATGLEGMIIQLTDGYGCDAVIIAASSSSLDPINLAGAFVKKKGTVVVVGAVPTGFDREPYYYNKEVTLKMSCSYGPGRYDSKYEIQGIDYPFPYVRWTENRNMKAFQDLIFNKKIDLNCLTTHSFKFNDLPLAYDMIMKNSEPFIGILIEYETEKQLSYQKLQIMNSRATKGSMNVGIIGAGSYAQKALLPNLSIHKNVILKGVMTSTPTNSLSVAKRFGFEFCASTEEDIFTNKEIDTIFIATRHDSHAHFVKSALIAGKNVFVEKPLCLSLDDLNEIRNCYVSAISGDSPPHLIVGFNRRFSPLIRQLKQKIPNGPMAMIYRINAGYVPTDSWIQDRNMGGGRILGEVCHFIDLLSFICDSPPTSVYTSAINDSNFNNDTLTVTLTYENGSIGTISYFANGSKLLSKEYVEIYSNGTTAILDDFKEICIFDNKKKYSKRLIHQDKGQHTEIIEFVDCVLSGKEPIIPIDSVFTSTLATLKVLDSIKLRNKVNVA